jgi:hypothetical protein
VVVQLNPQRAASPDEDEDPAKFYANISGKIGDGELLHLANELHEAVSADDASRSEWLANRAAAWSCWACRMEDPSGDGASAVDGQSVVTNPLLLEAVPEGLGQRAGRTVAGRGAVQGRQLQADQASEAQKDQLGECFQRDMNYFLTTHRDRVWPETSHMLLWGCYFGGSGFKKVYTHP